MQYEEENPTFPWAAAYALAHATILHQPDAHAIMPPSTSQIIIDRLALGTDSQACVDWAIGLLEQGHDTDFVGRLAGQTPPYGFDTIGVLRDQALEELGHENLSDEVLICQSIAHLLSASQDHAALRVTLHAARQLYTRYYMDALQPLYLLSFAVDDLEVRGDQHYVHGMDASNSEAVVAQVVANFIAEHQPDAGG